MIISHKQKFIFIKPTKVAGSSVEAALSKHCGPDDIITKLDYSKDSDHDKYDNSGRNSEKFRVHATPEEIKKRIPKKIWSNYYKITIVRNPWDMAVSRYFWENWYITNDARKKHFKKVYLKKIIKNIFKPASYLKILKILKIRKNPDNINYFLRTFSERLTNSNYYFDKKGNPICDFYIRYENLEEDYRKVCEHLGIPYEKLPRLKTKQRTEKKHYSTYYDEKAKKRITKICKKEIKYFNYKFEEKNDNLS